MMHGAYNVKSLFTSITEPVDSSGITSDVFARCSVCILARTPTTLRKVLRGFPDFLQADAEITRSLPYHFPLFDKTEPTVYSTDSFVECTINYLIM